MQISNEGTSPSNLTSKDEHGTRSIYVSQPSVCKDSFDHMSIGQKVITNSEQKPVLSIQVNENSPTFNQTTTNLVNIVSCFRAYSTITHSGFENIIQSNVEAPFSVSVSRSSLKCSENNNINESGCNENGQKVNNKSATTYASNFIAENSRVHPNTNINNSNSHNKCHDQILNSEKETASSSDNTSDKTSSTEVSEGDKLSIVEKDKSKKKITGSADPASESSIDQTTVACEIESVVNRATNDNCLKSEVNTFRERRERRRERRRVRNRAQHGHHHITVPVSVHHQVTGFRSGNVAEPSRTSYEILPDVINNHLPPPYTTVPQQPSAQPIHSPLSIGSVPIDIDDCRFSFPIPVITRSPSVHSGRKGCCGQIFQSPKSLGLIAMIALGGVICALGGAAWGASGLAGQPSTHLSISLLMIGIGVVLVTISGMAWKITTSENLHCLGIERNEFDHCGRPLCHRNDSLVHNILCPEFQHRSPPPTYQASMQEYRLRLLLMDRERQSNIRRFASAISSAVAHQTSTPPPTYRSNVGSQMRSQRRPFLFNNMDRDVNTSNLSNDPDAILIGSNIVPTVLHNNRSSSIKIPSTHQSTRENVPIQQISSAVTANQNQNSQLLNIVNNVKIARSSIVSNMHQNSNHNGMVTIVRINSNNNENV